MIFLYNRTAVHIGNPNSGHYVPYICPKLDGHWVKFDDRMVDESTELEAINENFGGTDKSAYVLIYVKTSCVPEIFPDVTIDEVNGKELIDREISEEINSFDPILRKQSSQTFFMKSMFSHLKKSIYVTVKNEAGDVLMWRDFIPSTKLSTIAHEIADIQVSISN